MSRVTMKHNKAFVLTCAVDRRRADHRMSRLARCRAHLSGPARQRTSLAPAVRARSGRSAGCSRRRGKRQARDRSDTLLIAFFKGKEIDRSAVDFTSAAPYSARVEIDGCPDELVLSMRQQGRRKADRVGPAEDPRS